MKRMFTQKQIENIANNIVENAISEALENVSPKLYLHLVSLSDGEDKSATIKIISKRNTIYDFESLYNDIYNDKVLSVVVNANDDSSDSIVLIDAYAGASTNTINVNSSLYYNKTQSTIGSSSELQLTQIDDAYIFDF